MRALDGTETAALLQKLQGSRLHVPVFVAVTTGLRRGELLALRWADVDLESGSMTVHQSLEQTSDGLRFKSPKTERGRRQVALPSFTMDVLRAHKVDQAKVRLKLGPIYQDNDLVFPRDDGAPWRQTTSQASLQPSCAGPGCRMSACMTCGTATPLNS